MFQHLARYLSVRVNGPKGRKVSGKPRNALFRHRLEAGLVAGWLGLMRRLPAGVRHSLTGRIGEWARFFDRRHASVARESLALRYGREAAGPKVRDVYRELGHLAGELGLLENRGSEELKALVEAIEGREHLETLASDPRGIIFVGAHLGNWELLGHMLPLYGLAPLHVVYRPLDNPLLDARLRRSRERHGTRTLERRTAIRPSLAALRQGGTVAMLLDQHTRGQGTVRVPFLGEVTPISTAPARLALQTGCPILSAALLREGPERFRLVAFPPLEPGPYPDSREGVARFTEGIVGLLEAGIARAPAQWFWVHRRWRERPRRLVPGSAPPPPWDGEVRSE